MSLTSSHHDHPHPGELNAVFLRSLEAALTADGMAYRASPSPLTFTLALILILTRTLTLTLTLTQVSLGWPKPFEPHALVPARHMRVVQREGDETELGNHVRRARPASASLHLTSPNLTQEGQGRRVLTPALTPHPNAAAP